MMKSKWTSWNHVVKNINSERKIDRSFDKEKACLVSTDKFATSVEE